MSSSFETTIWRKQESLARQAAEKEVEELTEEEKVAIYYMAGCQMNITDGDDVGTIRISTAQRAGIVKFNGKFKVYVETPRIESGILFNTNTRQTSCRVR